MKYSNVKLDELSNFELVEVYGDMAKWTHYDPMGEPRPCKFCEDELRNEIVRRLEERNPDVDDE